MSLPLNGDGANLRRGHSRCRAVTEMISPPPPENTTAFGVVVIGRNEGERLKQCLRSLGAAHAIVYVDSGSTDGSAQWVRDQGFDVVDLDMCIPFTAARARNAGFRRLRKSNPKLAFVQFIDGDCELDANWPQEATRFLTTHSRVAAVCGRLRERYPNRSVYNWLCDREWNGPVGKIDSFDGNVMIRADALEDVGGYREEVIAAEENELSLRIRSAGWTIFRIANPMGLHDAAMTHFLQWWRRTVRAGYAFAQGMYLHGAAPEHHFVWESRRALSWGVVMPITCLVIGLSFGGWAWTAWLIYPAQFLRQTIRNSGPVKERVTVAFFELLARFPEGWGQLKFAYDQFLKRQPQLIEHK